MLRNRFIGTLVFHILRVRLQLAEVVIVLLGLMVGLLDGTLAQLVLKNFNDVGDCVLKE